MTPSGSPWRSIGTPSIRRQPMAAGNADRSPDRPARPPADHRPGEDSSTGDLGRVGPHRVLGPKQLQIVRAHVVAGDEMEQLAIEAEHVREQAAAESDSVAHDRLEHRLHVGRRGADHAKDRGRRRLLLQCLGQLAGARLHLVEQAHVLDRDHRLVGEGGDQLDLLLGERPDDVARQGDHADHRTAAQQGHAEHGSEFALRLRLEPSELGVFEHVGDVHGRCLRVRSGRLPLPALNDRVLRHIVARTPRRASLAAAR